MEDIRRIVRIGNSSGIVLPKKLIYYARLNDVFYLKAKVKKNRIILSPTTKNRK